MTALKGQQCQCGTCGRTFGGLSGFDFHIKGVLTDEHPKYGRECMDDEELKAHGWREREGIWRKPMPPELIERLKNGRS